MKKLLVPFVILASLILLAGRCGRHDGWTAGGPITMFLLGTWQLEKIVTPSRTLLGSQIGFSEKLVIISNDGHIENTFRDDTLTGTEVWRINPAPIAKTKDMTVSISYRYGLKRFYKLHRTTSQPTILEASAYLPELGAAADTVKYFYKEVW
ncbi:hypothetical protein LZG74_17245 [Dyadobacter sp. CY327]|uniref:hypothetical protein n=1 Tax=Dyadobacter sp. CY327 TaxID=2907301 RepID=UPI001F1F75B4|nr:hypothetical protein [Dyadobacter sp. CY327]MCE7072066.1 hypothetical protein [Dyadobacter sp. CY327]